MIKSVSQTMGLILTALAVMLITSCASTSTTASPTSAITSSPASTAASSPTSAATSSPVPSSSAIAVQQAAHERIVFASKRTGSMQIYVMDTDGANTVQLTDSAGSNLWPRWSPDNSQIVFQSTRDGGSWEIYIMNADGSNQTRLTDSVVSNDWPNWSKDGQRIIWTHGGYAYTMATDGTGQKQLTPGGPLEGYICYSPDGQRFAYEAPTPGDATSLQVYSAGLDGSAVTEITSRGDTLNYPNDWLGNKVLFTSRFGTTNQLWLTDGDGQNQTLLSDGSRDGSFAPDGKRVVLDRNGEICVMNVDGTGLKVIAPGPGLNAKPDWSN